MNFKPKALPLWCFEALSGSGEGPGSCKEGELEMAQVGKVFIG